MKLNRILLFIESEKLEKELSDQQTKELKNLLFRGCDTGLFNKFTILSQFNIILKIVINI